MARLIDVDALRKDFKVAEQCDNCPQCNRRCDADVVFSRRDICGMLDDAEIVDAELVRHGRWEYLNCFEKGRYQCSECGHFIDAGADMNYCPNCGAKMKGDENADN